jgi:hypothetical protein
MDTAWIQVFILTLSECVAPAGKTVCQEREFELQFLTEADCEYALEQFITLKDASENVIVNRDRSRCAPSARESHTFESLAAINEAYRDRIGWRVPGPQESQPSNTLAAHQKRLAALRTCDESEGVAPCKIGDIIIEGASGDPVEVWRRDN